MDIQIFIMKIPKASRFVKENRNRLVIMVIFSFLLGIQLIYNIHLENCILEFLMKAIPNLRLNTFYSTIFTVFIIVASSHLFSIF